MPRRQRSSRNPVGPWRVDPVVALWSRRPLWGRQGGTAAGAWGLFAALVACTPAAGPAAGSSDDFAAAWVGRDAVVLWGEVDVRRFPLSTRDPLEGLRALQNLHDPPSHEHDEMPVGPRVVAGDDEALALHVLATVGGLLVGCEQPVRVRLSPGLFAVPLMPVAFHACRAEEPVRYCSAAGFEVYADRIDVVRSANPIGVDCPHGAHGVLRSPLYAERDKPRPPRPEARTERFSRRRAVEDMLERPRSQAGLEECSDTFVRFHGTDTTWGEARVLLAEIDRALGARLTFDVVDDSPADR